MIKKISDNIWQITCRNFGSHVYVVKLNNQNVLIDTDARANRDELISELKRLKINPSDVDVVILTHAHYDHVENVPIFRRAKIYGSKRDFKQKKVIDIDKLRIPEFEIIKTPGHSHGSICILYKDVLFSGDTIFHRKTIGRTDLPGSDENEMRKSLDKLRKIKFRVLAPGHGVE